MKWMKEVICMKANDLTRNLHMFQSSVEEETVTFFPNLHGEIIDSKFSCIHYINSRKVEIITNPSFKYY